MWRRFGPATPLSTWPTGFIITGRALKQKKRCVCALGWHGEGFPAFPESFEIQGRTLELAWGVSQLSNCEMA